MLITRIPHRARITALAGAAALAVSGCGGGDPAQEFAAAMHAASSSAAAAGGEDGVRRRLSIPTVPSAVDEHAALDWAEYKYPELFPRGALSFSVTYQGTRYTARAYTGAWGTRYVGITAAGLVFGLGDFTNNALQSYGRLTDYAAQVVAERCGVYPGACDNGEPTGPLNVCTMPAAQALATGTRVIVETETRGDGYVSTVRSDSVVDGAATFEGNNVTQVSMSITSATTLSGVTSTTTSTSRIYMQGTAGGFLRQFGAETSTTTPGVPIGGVLVAGGTTQTRTVHSPPSVERYPGLSVGGSITGTVTATTTANGTGFPTTTSTLTTSSVYTFEAREAITVRGKTYDTCRYRVVAAPNAGSESIFWAVVGKGVQVRAITNVTTEGGAISTGTTELVSGTINGVPI